MFHVPEKYRVKTGPMGSDKSLGNNGAFVVPKYNGYFHVIASDGLGWEHVSVSLPTRTPTWGEMCMIKDLFWEPEDCVVQFHPPKTEYVNNHDYCLHLWRRIGSEFEGPPSILL